MLRESCGVALYIDQHQSAAAERDARDLLESDRLLIEYHRDKNKRDCKRDVCRDGGCVHFPSVAESEDISKLQAHDDYAQNKGRPVRFAEFGQNVLVL